MSRVAAPLSPPSSVARARASAPPSPDLTAAAVSSEACFASSLFQPNTPTRRSFRVHRPRPGPVLQLVTVVSPYPQTQPEDICRLPARAPHRPSRTLGP